MRYDEAVAAFFPARPEGTPVPEAVSAGTPARRLRDAIEPLATFPIWSRRVNEALADLGLDFLAGYVWGRAAALGWPSAGAATAAFAWFEPTLVAGILEAGQSEVRRDVLLKVRDREAAAGITEVLTATGTSAAAGTSAAVGAAEVADLDRAADLLLAAARSLPVLGRPLYAGLLDRPVPVTPAGRLQRACELLREARGDAHVAVAVGAGLGPVEMNVLTELWVGMELGSYTVTRGWSAEAQAAAVDRLRERGWLAGEALSEQGRAARAGLEAATDAAMAPAVAALGADFDLAEPRLAGWSDLCIRAGAFPADALKRAAG